MIYRYDGTFDGFLTVVALAREQGETPDAITRSDPEQGGLFATVVPVETDPDRARPLAAKLTRTLSPDARRMVCYAFQAEAPGVEMHLWHYLELARQRGREIDRLLAHDQVLPVWTLARAVGREAHRYKGLVRFRQVEGDFWYAPVEPEHRILSLIAPHFAARFGDQRWLIHDVRRGEAVVFDPERREWASVSLAVTGELPPTAGEELFRELWTRYFDRLAIAERHNPQLQRQNLPLKHRRHLPEFSRE